MKYRTAISCNTKYSNAVSSIRDIEKKVDLKQSVLWHQQFRNQNTLIQLHGDGGREGLEQPYYRFTSVPTTETPTTRCTDKNYCGCRENISPVQKMMQVCERLEFQQFCLFQTGTTVGVEKPLAIQETYGTDLQVGPAFLCHVSKERNTRARTHSAWLQGFHPLHLIFQLLVILKSTIAISTLTVSTYIQDTFPHRKEIWRFQSVRRSTKMMMKTNVVVEENRHFL